MKSYDHTTIEPYWQKTWEDSQIYAAKDNDPRKKFYSLIEFPYPSGDGLHTGHIRSNTAMDIVSRKRRMEGYNVLYPIGWDAFGLPTENYAIKTGIHPTIVTKKNTDTFRSQLKAVGFSFDWNREINTTDPDYYKWTQWIFLQMYKEGLAYKKKATINWCPSCKIGLANEEVIGGHCERCGHEVEKRQKEQWMLAITKYADRLYEDLDKTDFLESIKLQQRNWIGPSTGSELSFKIADSDLTIDVFTTRADTLFGATYVVLAPEHELVEVLMPKIGNKEAVQNYQKVARQTSDADRVAEDKEKTGVQLEGVYAINPTNNEKIPVWIADYVLADYGTGAVMAVPAHDTRDYQFAKKYTLPIIPVIAKVSDVARSYLMGAEEISDADLSALKIEIVHRTAEESRVLDIPDPSIPGYEKLISDKLTPGYWNEYVGKQTVFIFKHKDGKVERIELTHETEPAIDRLTAEFSGGNPENSTVWMWLADNEWYRDLYIHTDYGTLINSGQFTGRPSEEAKAEITEFVGGKVTKTFKLRDWVFSRQRYWGEPIPMIHCEYCGWVPVPEKDLPVTLPMVEKYEPTDTGESPLATINDWVNTSCPKCGKPARRETDTMPNWAGSSWYFLRYIDPHNNAVLADRVKLDYWGQVDWYNGGMEHVTLHLLYSRFWNKFLYDIGVVPYDEPYLKRSAHGMILAAGGVKMSKSKGNVVNPDSIIEEHGADTLRIYEMFMGPFDQAIAWDTKSIIGSRRFLDRVWNLLDKVADVPADSSHEAMINQLIEKVSNDIERMSFNTAIAAMMSAVNTMEKSEAIAQPVFERFLQILAPFTPHITEELWKELGHMESVHLEKWPMADAAKLVAAEVEVVVQINGKVRHKLVLPSGLAEKQAVDAVLKEATVQKWIEGKEVRKTIYVPDKLVNLVVG